MSEMSSVESTMLKGKKLRRRESMWGERALMDEGEEQKQVEEEEVVESTERSTRLSPVQKVQFQRLDAATTTSPWKAMVTLHSAGDNKRLYFLISREREQEEESGFHGLVCFFQQEKRGRGGGGGRGINVGNVFGKRQRTSLVLFWGLSFL